MIRVFLIAACALLLAACDGDARSRGNLVAPNAAAATQATLAATELGRKVYNFRCYYCHGYSGDARTLASTFLSPQPRDFTSAASQQLSRETIIAAVRHGRPGTAMASFEGTLNETEIAAVADFVRDEFIQRKAENTRYHTAANGWPNHERYRAAFPFARGDIALDTPFDQLSPELAAGRRLFVTTCISCHDRGRSTGEEMVWEMRALSYPPNIDACAGCHRYSQALHGRPVGEAHAAMTKEHYTVPRGPFEQHDKAPQVQGLSTTEQRGEQLFQKNCTFCHAADGSGRNWIGVFLEPHPRDLSDRAFIASRTRAQLRTTIRDGVAGTSMPAWKSVLPEQDIDAVVAYLARAFGPPAQ